jgi:hypothetical protein
MESRPPNVEGKGEVSPRDCLKNALRMRPDRIIVGETRGEEVIDMLQAMNTGHDGSMTTIHANSPATAISRLENMVAMAGIEMPLKAVRSQIAQRRQPDRAGQPPAGRLAPDDLDHRNHRDGRRRDLDAGDLPLPARRPDPGQQDHRAFHRHRRALAITPNASACGAMTCRLDLRTHACRSNDLMQLSARTDHLRRLIFVGVLVLVEGPLPRGLRQIDQPQQPVNRRLEMLDKGRNREQVLESSARRCSST